MADKQYQYQHPGGRICTLCDDGEWRYGDRHEYVCDATPHEVTGGERGPVLTVNGDRGEFGMPTVGAAKFDLSQLQGDDTKVDVLHPQRGKATTQEAHRIMNQHLPRTMERFLKNNTKYAKVQTGHDLGAKGIIPDINRKTGVLIDRIWDGSPTVGEETPEVIEDLIGHLFLLLDKLVPVDDGLLPEFRGDDE